MLTLSFPVSGAIFSLTCVRARAQGDDHVLNIGSRLELFVDDTLIERVAGVTQELHHPAPQNVALEFNAPWEGPTSCYVTVFRDEDRCRMYYRGSNHEGANFHQLTCYAESPDGIHWSRPNLGLFEWQGSKENNIVWVGPGEHNFAPFRDENPTCKPEERYKAVAGGPLVAIASPDAVHWKLMREEPIITEGAFDSDNLAFWDSLHQEYVCYLRDFANGVRTIRRATSMDFLNWTRPEWLDYGEAPQEHLYTNAVQPYLRAPHLYLGFPKRFVPTRKKVPTHPYDGLSDGVFMCSRDGLHFRRYIEAFIRPGLDPNNWTDRNMMPATGLIQTSPEELSIYYVENYRHDSCRLRRATIRTDGFVSMSAGYPGGEFVTRPLSFNGACLLLNYETSAIGSLRVEVQDSDGNAIPGYTLDDCQELYGDEIEGEVRWQGGNLTALAGRAVRLRFVMVDADLYAFRFSD
ncbi:MAG: hypothetical protein ACUVX8_08500 [Candidatus Zipacnadales bacterium]